jgi:hypothetical protein
VTSHALGKDVHRSSIYVRGVVLSGLPAVVFTANLFSNLPFKHAKGVVQFPWETREAQAVRSTPLSAAFEHRVLSLEREEDWDGQEADAITADTCKAALQFVRRLLAIKPDLPLPFPAPSVYGAISRWGG